MIAKHVPNSDRIERNRAADQAAQPNATRETLTDDQLEQVSGGLTYKLERCFVKSWSTSGVAD